MATDAEKNPSLSVSSLPLGPGVALLHKERGLLALYKPEGVKAHPNKGGKGGVDKKALLAAPYDLKGEYYDLREMGGGKLHLLHRLDSPTSGLIILCENDDLAAHVRALFARHMVKKCYHALVFGDAGKGVQPWKDRLLTARGRGMARTSVGAGDMASATARVIQKGNAGNGLPVSHIALEPGTGKTHQLRVQCATRKLPIVGDATYGNFSWNRRAEKELRIRRLCLHSHSIAFDYSFEGQKRQFKTSCKVPDCFTTVFGR